MAHPNERDLDGTANPRKFFGSELRRLREAAGLKQGPLGKLVFVSPQYISHLETAFRTPNDLEFVQRLDDALSADGHLVRVYRMAERTEEESQLADYFAAVAALEPTAQRIDWYGAALIPGLLQTQEYAEEITRASGPFRTNEEIAELVAARIKRADTLHNPTGPKLLVILDEAALRRPIGGPKVMRGQLSHVSDVIRARRAVVQVLPYSAGAHPLLSGQLIIMRFADTPPLAYIEGPHGGQVMDKQETLDACMLSYDLARASALSPEASLTLLESVTEEYTR
ncbi:helix-turn-helix transcriptional regulator [Streptomyces sp. ISL-100]|uniref:helix-turn-helix domain-containing protein n=1 Tax=Streptomyces sp. ISL-100 TaxID=2819173 RepID=UPI001BE8F692|nr:helix-turn-helix transcriptional regulator [Streptomyces sp. ISL-100]MBT2396010.1 helix-turn-helix domain-containing protein [Streptomyces sp. ISL-100]